MAATVFTVRQFFALPSLTTSLEGGTPAGTFIVTGSLPSPFGNPPGPFSGLLINNTRTNLSQDNVVIDEITYSGTSSFGWFPGPSTATSQSLIIVGGNPNFTNTVSDGRAGGSKISCWGITGSNFSQGAYDTAFVTLASQINSEFDLGATVTNTAEARDFCLSFGLYYQYPVPLAGQSVNTGNGSD
jgi:hypothetical protein